MTDWERNLKMLPSWSNVGQHWGPMLVPKLTVELAEGASQLHFSLRSPTFFPLLNKLWFEGHSFTFCTLNSISDSTFQGILPITPIEFNFSLFILLHILLRIPGIGYIFEISSWFPFLLLINYVLLTSDLSSLTVFSVMLASPWGLQRGDGMMEKEKTHSFPFASCSCWCLHSGWLQGQLARATRTSLSRPCASHDFLSSGGWTSAQSGPSPKSRSSCCLWPRDPSGVPAGLFVSQNCYLR